MICNRSHQRGITPVVHIQNYMLLIIFSRRVRLQDIQINALVTSKIIHTSASSNTNE